MQNKTRTQEISALGHLVIQNSSGPVNDKSFYADTNCIPCANVHGVNMV